LAVAAQHKSIKFISLSLQNEHLGEIKFVLNSNSKREREKYGTTAASKQARKLSKGLAAMMYKQKKLNYEFA